MIELPAATIEGMAGDRFTVIVPKYAHEAWTLLLQNNAVKKSCQMYVKCGPPRKPRTKGAKSQNHAIHGYATQIGEFTGDYKEDIIAEAKRRAVTRGYPTHEDSFGNYVPDSERDISTVEAGYLIEELHMIASYLDVRLKEYE